MRSLKISNRLRLVITLILMMIVIALAACSDPMHPSGRFFNAFSLGNTVNRLNVSELQHSYTSGSGGSSAGDPTPYRKGFVQEFRIKDPAGSRFDEQEFLRKLRMAIDQEVRDSNVNLTGQGTSGDSFYINYQDGENNGAVEVMAARVENDRYKIWCVVRELSVSNKH